MNELCRRHERLLATLLLALALGLRLFTVLHLLPDLVFGDQAEYLAGATRLLSGLPLAAKNEMFFVRAPGYSLFVALVWGASGVHTTTAIKLAQVLVGTATCAYVWRATRLIGGSALGGLGALALAAVYPYLLYQTASVGTEALFAFFVIAGLFHLARGFTRTPPALGELALASLLLAAANLLRPNLSTFLPLLGLWIVWRHWRTPRTVVAIALALLLPLLAVTLPWTFAVRRQGLGWVWVTDGGGIWYYMGHNPAAPKVYGCAPATPEELARLLTASDYSGAPYREAPTLPPAEQQGAFWRAALQWDRQNAKVLPCLMLRKTWFYWRPWVNPAAYGRGALVASLLSLPLLLLGAVGLWRARSTPYAAIVTLNAVAGTVVAALASTEIRYRIPVVDVPFMALAAYALDSLRRRSHD